MVVSWDLYQAADSEHEHIYIGLTEWVGEDDENDVLEEVLNADATSFEFSRDLLKAGRQYSLYVEFVNLTEAIDPEGFSVLIKETIGPFFPPTLLPLLHWIWKSLAIAMVLLMAQ